MSTETTPDPKEVLARLHWVKARAPEFSVAPVDWQAAAAELHDALDTSLKQLEMAGLCHKCGEPLGLYCVRCAWPGRRRHERKARD
jgi:hypothetical protein